MTSFLFGLTLIVLIAVVTTALGTLSLRIAAAIDGHRPGRIAAVLRPDATVPLARLDRGEEDLHATRGPQPMQRLSPVEREGLPHHTMTFIGLR